VATVISPELFPRSIIIASTMMWDDAHFGHCFVRFILVGGILAHDPRAVTEIETSESVIQ
jgi:hypothetical protein